MIYFAIWTTGAVWAAHRVWKSFWFTVNSLMLSRQVYVNPWYLVICYSLLIFFLWWAIAIHKMIYWLTRPAKSDIHDHIQNGFDSYKRALLQMSDRELYFHCFEDDDVEEGDLCLKELHRRGIERFRPCHNCIGSGCTTCNGMGKIPWFE